MSWRYVRACARMCVCVRARAGGSSLDESVPCCAFESASPRPCFPLTHFLSVFPFSTLRRAAAAATNHHAITAISGSCLWDCTANSAHELTKLPARTRRGKRSPPWISLGVAEHFLFCLSRRCRLFPTYLLRRNFPPFSGVEYFLSESASDNFNLNWGIWTIRPCFNLHPRGVLL